MRDIVQKQDPILRGVAKPVPISEIGTPQIQGIISDMLESMKVHKDGIAIAAPQIGVDLRIFAISGKLLKQADKSYKGDGSDLVFINPEISKASKEKKEMEEGCLSVRWLYGTVKRSVRVTLKAYDMQGNKLERGASGLLAQIFQHEVDHLNGILFTDHAKNLWEMTEEEIADLERA